MHDALEDSHRRARDDFGRLNEERPSQFSLSSAMTAVFRHPLPLWGIAVDKYKIDITEMVVGATAIISIALAARDAAGAQWISEEWDEARLVMAPDQPPGVRSAASSDRCPSAE